ncbi:MAG TPA: hypothetical protein VMV33_14340 [Rhodocyclaceae bacterium]|nr:hypothetical protein [Rhodocyclaceae bacterium]
MRGYTLISLMVGMLISLIVSLGMLMLYKALISIAGEATTQANLDGQAASSRLVAEEELQQAGFGTTGQFKHDLVLLTGATLGKENRLAGTEITDIGSGTRGNALIWGYNPTAATSAVDPGAYLCAGLLVSGNVLQWLAPATCNGASQWSKVRWVPHPLASPINQVVDVKAHPAKDDSISSAPLEVVATSCWPYGATTAINALQVSYYAKDSSKAGDGSKKGKTGKTDTVVQAPLFSVCLPNFLTGSTL